MEQGDKLTWKSKLLYGVGDVGNAMVNSAILFFLLIFYTDAALIIPALAGGALAVGKLWDAVNDPLFGWISDRTTSRFGKRRVYMIFGALPLAVSVALLWRVGPCLQIDRHAGHWALQLGAPDLGLYTQCGADNGDAPGHSALLWPHPFGNPADRRAVVNLVSYHPKDPC